MTPNHDEATEKVLVELITPGVYTSDQASAVIDMEGYEAATLLIHVGIGGITFSGTNKIEFVLTHGDASDGSDGVAVTDADLVKDSLCPATVTAGIVRSLVSAHASADVQKLGYVGGHRYVKLVPDFSGTHGTGTPIAASLVKEQGALQGVA
jgi:hypothetical protein